MSKTKKRPKTKKAAPAPTKAPVLGELMPLPGDILPAARRLVQAEVSINQEDVLSVAISRAEEHINDLIKDAQAEAVRLGEESSELYKTICKSMNDEAQATFKDRCEQLVTAVSLFAQGKKAGYTISAQYAQLDNDKATGGTYHVTVHLSGKRLRSISFSEPVKASAELLELLKQARTLQKGIEDANNKALDAKRRLGQLPTLERKYRARLAEARIRSEQGGDELLQHLIGDVQADVLRLPGLR